MAPPKLLEHGTVVLSFKLSQSAINIELETRLYIRASVDTLCRDGTEMRRTLKASKLRECENISFFRHFIICYSSLITC